MKQYEQQAQIGPSPYEKNSGVAEMREQMEQSVTSFVEEMAQTLTALDIRPLRKGLTGYIEERKKRTPLRVVDIDSENTVI